METKDLHNSSAQKPARPLSIFNYCDYREFLRDFYQLKKSLLDNYSYAVFSLRAGIKSPNYLKLVMEGQRNLTTENTLAFAKGLGLNELETLYWENLVSFTQAKTPVQRQSFLMLLGRTTLPEGMENSRLIREVRNEWDYYASWYHAAIREMVMLPDFDPTPSAIAAKLRGRITAEEARASIELLKRLGFLVADAQGRLRQNEMHVRYKTAKDVINLSVRRFHKASAKLAVDCLEEDSEEAHEERNYSSLTIAVNRKTYPLIKARLASYLRELNTEFSIAPHCVAPEGPGDGADLAPTATPADQVYQLNLQLLPLTLNPVSKPKGKSKKPGEASFARGALNDKERSNP